MKEEMALAMRIFGLARDYQSNIMISYLGIRILIY